MNRMARFVFIPALSLSLNGCVNSKPIHYYTVQLPVAPTLSTSTHFPCLYWLGYRGGGYISRYADRISRRHNRIGAYQYSRWAGPPVELVKDKLIRILRASGDYQSVTGLGSKTSGQFVVRGRLYEFAEVDGA